MVAAALVLERRAPPARSSPSLLSLGKVLRSIGAFLSAHKLGKYRAKLEDWLAAKLATYDKDAAVRAKENAKHGNRAGYNEYLCRLRDQKYDAEVDKKVREAAGIVQKANSQGLVDGRVPPPRSLAAGPAPAPAPHAEARSGKPPQSTRV